VATARGYGIDVTLSGAGAAARALRSYDRSLSERLIRDLRRPALTVAAKARAGYPVVSGQSRRGVKVKLERKGRHPFQLKIQQTARGGSIIEFAANAKSAQGRNLINTLSSRYGAPGRIMWDAWDSNKSAFESDLRAAVMRVDAEITAALDAAGG